MHLSSFSSVLLHLTQQLFPACCCYRDESVAWQDWWTSALKDLIPMCNLRFSEPATVRHLEKMWNGSVLYTLLCHMSASYMLQEGALPLISQSSCVIYFLHVQCTLDHRPTSWSFILVVFWSDVILSNSVLLVLRRQQESIFCLIWMLHEERKPNKKKI